MTPPSGRRPRRGHRPRKERRVIRVLTEGKVTEPSYLIAWARRHRHSISLSLPESGMAPETLVDHARQHLRRRRRSRRGDQDFDEIWCVFDIDLHPNVPTAIHNARQSGIEVAVSNPCIELWLVLHPVGEARAELQLPLVHGKVRDAPPELEQLLAWVAILLILQDRVVHRLLGQVVLQLEGEHRQPVDEQSDVQPPLRLVPAAAKLPRDCEAGSARTALSLAGCRRRRAAERIQVQRSVLGPVAVHVDDTVRIAMLVSDPANDLVNLILCQSNVKERRI